MNNLINSMLSIILINITIITFAQNQIIIPDTLSGSNFNLSLQNGVHSFISGQTTNTMGVNGNVLGPTLIMQKGDFVNIQVHNNLSESTTIHWHGMHVSSENDGGPHTVIHPGEIWTPKFTVFDHAGTYWYHPHLHEKTNEHVSKGISGFILVKDELESEIDLPRSYGIDDIPIVIQTKDFNENYQIVSPSNSDDVVMVNATINASINLPAQIVRLRLLNGSSQRVFNIGLTDNKTFHQIGSDGGLFATTVELSRLLLAPGERAELLIDLSELYNESIKLMSYASELENGIYGANNPGMMPMMSLDGYHPNSLNGSDFDLLNINVVEQSDYPVLEIPTNLVPLHPISEDSSDITRIITFTPETMGPDQLNGHFLINGQSFDMNIINYTIPLNNVEIWEITNQSGIAHPFHIHDVQFFILDRDGNIPTESENGRKDVVFINPMETVRIITQFTNFANPDIPYMYHCHMLTHEDEGMMGQFVVIDNETGVQNSINPSNEIRVFPNPSVDGKINIISNQNIESFEVLGLLGNFIYGQSNLKNKKEININISGINSGTYILNIKSATNYHIKKIILH